MRTEKEYLNLRLVYRKNLKDKQKFYLNDHTAEVMRNPEDRPYFFRGSEMVFLKNEDYISNGHPSPLTGGEIGGMIGVTRMLGREIRDYIYESQRLFNAITREDVEKYDPYFRTPIAKSQPKTTFYLESADYSNNECVVRKVLFVSDSKNKLEEKKAELEVKDPGLKYLIWVVKKI